MKKLLILFALVTMLAACSKDKFKTEPTVTIDSFGPAEVNNGDVIQLFATVTDQEGDLQDSVIVVRKRFNGDQQISVDSSARVSIGALGHPNARRIELRVLISYGRLRPEEALFQDLERTFDRNFSVGLIVRDNAGNRSEYVESEKIVLKRF